MWVQRALLGSSLVGERCKPDAPDDNSLAMEDVMCQREVSRVVPSPGRCDELIILDGLIIFDGRRWVAELTPPTSTPDAEVSMRLTAEGELRFISPSGFVGFQPYAGQPLAARSG